MESPTLSSPLSIINVDLSYKGLTNLDDIKKNKNLIEIDVTGNDLGKEDEALTPLLSMPFLKKVNLSDNNLTYWPNMPKSMETLILMSNQLTQLSDNLLIMPRLMTIDISNNQIIDISLLVKLTNLRNIFAKNNKIVNFSVLSELTKLSEIDLEGNPIKDPEQFKAFENHQAIKVIKIKNTPIMSQQDFLLSPQSFIENLPFFKNGILAKSARYLRSSIVYTSTRDNSNPNRSVVANKSLIGSRRKLTDDEELSDDELLLEEEQVSEIKSSLLGSVRSNFLEGAGIVTAENSFRRDRSRNISVDWTRRGLYTFDSRGSTEKENDKTSPFGGSPRKNSFQKFHQLSSPNRNMRLDLSTILKGTGFSKNLRFTPHRYQDPEYENTDSEKFGSSEKKHPPPPLKPKFKYDDENAIAEVSYQNNRESMESKNGTNTLLVNQGQDASFCKSKKDKDTFPQVIRSSSSSDDSTERQIKIPETNNYNIPVMTTINSLGIGETENVDSFYHGANFDLRSFESPKLQSKVSEIPKTNQEDNIRINEDDENEFGVLESIEKRLDPGKQPHLSQSLSKQLEKAMKENQELTKVNSELQQRNDELSKRIMHQGDQIKNLTEKVANLLSARANSPKNFGFDSNSNSSRLEFEFGSVKNSLQNSIEDKTRYTSMFSDPEMNKKIIEKFDQLTNHYKQKQERYLMIINDLESQLHIQMAQKLKDANAKISEYQSNYSSLLQKYTGLKRNALDRKRHEIPSKNVSLINSPISNNSRISSGDLDNSQSFMNTNNNNSFMASKQQKSQVDNLILANLHFRKKSEEQTNKKSNSDLSKLKAALDTMTRKYESAAKEREDLKKQLEKGGVVKMRIRELERENANLQSVVKKQRQSVHQPSSSSGGNYIMTSTSLIDKHPSNPPGSRTRSPIHSPMLSSQHINKSMNFNTIQSTTTPQNANTSVNVSLTQHKKTSKHTESEYETPHGSGQKTIDSSIQNSKERDNSLQKAKVNFYMTKLKKKSDSTEKINTSQPIKNSHAQRNYSTFIQSSENIKRLVSPQNHTSNRKDKPALNNIYKQLQNTIKPGSSLMANRSSTSGLKQSKSNMIKTNYSVNRSTSQIK